MRVFDVPGKRALWRSAMLPMPVEVCFTNDSKALLMPAENGIYSLDATTGEVRTVLGTNAWFPSSEPTPDGHHITIQDIRTRDGKPFRPDKGRMDRDDLVSLWRVVHLDTGREVFRGEPKGFCRTHFPGGGRKMIQIILRNHEDAHDATCWEIPRR